MQRNPGRAGPSPYWGSRVPVPESGLESAVYPRASPGPRKQLRSSPQGERLSPRAWSHHTESWQGTAGRKGHTQVSSRGMGTVRPITGVAAPDLRGGPQAGPAPATWAQCGTEPQSPVRTLRAALGGLAPTLASCTRQSLTPGLVTLPRWLSWVAKALLSVATVVTESRAGK